jgi:SAM-dependent methyltransferase
MSNNDYISVVYEEKRTPKTDYPFLLAEYLCKRFSLDNDARLLEVGCGRGDFLRAFKESGLQCRAVDLSSSAIQLNSPEFEVKQLDVSCQPLPFHDDCFDTVFSKSLIEHMWDASYLIAEIHRVLRPGGIVITLTPDWVSQMETFYEDYTHCRPYTTESLQDLLVVSGFKDIHTELFHQHPLIWKSPFFRVLANFIGHLLSTRRARKLSQITGVKYFRWAVELMVLGVGYK